VRVQRFLFCNSSRINAMVRGARRHPRLAKKCDRLRHGPYELSCRASATRGELSPGRFADAVE
jgi:hypothetical protein